MGKTTLLDAWAVRERERGGLRFLTATCVEMEQGFIFSVARQLLEPLLRDQPSHEETLGQVLRTPAPEGLAAELHTLYMFLAELSRESAYVLVIDDVHFADEHSLRWLSYLSRRVADLRLLVVLSGWFGEHRLLNELCAGHVLTPGSLTLDGVAHLLGATLGATPEPAFATACHEFTGGAPYLVSRLLRVLADVGLCPVDANVRTAGELAAQAVNDQVNRCLVAQPEATRRLVRVLALLGGDTQGHVVAAMADLHPRRLEEHLTRLRRLSILAESTPTRFSHPLIRQAVLDRMPDLAIEYATAASLLHRDQAPTARTAACLLHAGPLGEPWVVPVLLDAAYQARDMGEHGLRLSYLRRALREPVAGEERIGLLMELAKAELFGDPAAAARRLREVLSLLTDPEARAKASGVLATALKLSRRAPEALPVLDAAIDMLDAEQHWELRLHLEAQIVQIGLEEFATIPAALAKLESLRSRGLSGSTPGERACLAALALHAMAGHGSAKETADLAARALSGGLWVAGPGGLLSCLSIVALIVADRWDEAQGWLAELSAQAIRHPLPWLRLMSAYGSVVMSHRDGALEDGATTGLDMLAEIGEGAGYSVMTLVAVVANCLMDAGSIPQAGQLLTRHAARDMPEAAWDRGTFLFSLGRLRLARGEHSAAVSALLECGRHQDTSHITNPAITPWLSRLALAYLGLGERERALEAAERELELSRRWGTPRAIGVSLGALGLVTGGSHGLDQLREAVGTIDEARAKLEQARIRLDLGLMLIQAGELAEARDVLRVAQERSALCQAPELSKRIQVALRGAGGRPRAAQPSAVLSRSEHEVAHLAVSGCTNKEIAGRLYVTPRTVEIHLTSTYRKLGISGRGQLAEAMRRLEN